MNQIQTYVICNAKRDITLDDVARYVGMNRASFCIFFKKATGKTFVTYLNEYRIGLACQLLRQKRMTVSEICYNVGLIMCHILTGLLSVIKASPPVNTNKVAKLMLTKKRILV